MLDASLLPLQNDRARIRPLRRDDAHAFAEGAADPAVRAFAHLPEPDYSPASVATMVDEVVMPGLARGDLAVLAIADPETDGFAGSIVLFDVSASRAEAGFWLHPAHRGAGRARAALDLAIGFARQSGLDQLVARTVVDNPGSMRVLAASGFRETGRGPGTTPSGADVELASYVRELGRDPPLPLVTPGLRP